MSAHEDKATILEDTTAQHEIISSEEQKEFEMNDDPSSAPKPEEGGNHGTRTGSAHQSLNVEGQPSPPRSPPFAPVEKFNDNLAARSNGDPPNDKSDSEAETVVMSGKEEGREHKMKKAIKLEEAGGAEPEDGLSENLPTIVEDQRESYKELNSRKPSLKRKRSMPELETGDAPDGGISSNLSSTISSPVQVAHSSKATDTGSDRSRSSPPFEEAAHQEESSVNNEKNGNGNIHSRHQRGKSDRGTEIVNGRKRRDTRSATHYDESNRRSESPPSHYDRKAQPTQTSAGDPGVTKRRKAPAPLYVERRRKASEDTHAESDDSSSVHSHNHVHKLASTENNAMSPAKMVTHKKNRDRNGRTWLARACAQGATEAEKWLKERPEDIDVPDNAGNTPLQIAALEGDTEVVQLLLDAGCKTTCKNIDKDTPLIDAVENGHLEVVKMLLKAGLDPRIGNANGSKPLELVREDDDEAEEIRAALVACEKEKESLRRPSEDHMRQHSTDSRDIEMTGMDASGASPVNGGRSPPPPGPGARRRTARSQPTDDALLWVNATPGRLRDAAGKGDLTIVDHILKMRPKADTESVLAAARGGHDVVLGLLLAIGDVDPDPEPLRSGEYKPGFSTPMLATIGRGNTNVIQLLLGQPGFNPTRRLFKGMSYHELAKERQGAEWEEEYDILKEAYDNYTQSGGRKSNTTSPRKVRTKRADSTKSSEPSLSPHEARKARKASSLKKEESPDTIKRNSHKALTPKNGKEPKRQASSTNSSDHELEPLGPPKSKPKDVGSFSSKRADSLKPKRRLMSGNEVKSDQDTKRRPSIAAETSELPRRKSGDSVFGHDNRRRRSSDASESKARIRSEEPLQIKGEPGKKRHRTSVSPQASKSDMAATADTVTKKKRQRVDSQGNAVDQDRDRTFRPGPPMVANMIASPTALASPPAPPPTQPQGTAPVAFMGSAVGSPVTKSPTELNPPSTLISPVNSIDQTLQPPKESDDTQEQKQFDDDIHCQEKIKEEREHQASTEEEERIARIEVEKEEQAEAERERQAQAKREEAERKARFEREAEEARLDAQRQAEEAERQIQQEREEEEARLAKKKRDEEMQKRRLEQERHRKEEQERRRREHEERESLRRLRLQEEEERLRRASLPNGLRRAAELSTDEARTAKEITKWLPLRMVTTQELDPNGESQLPEDMWIANIQAAPVLAIKDLELSQCKCPILAYRQFTSMLTIADTAWTRFPASINHRGSLWRQLRNPMSQDVPLALLSPTEVFNLDEETRPKFFSLPHVFWIKLSDFMDIVPRHQHLAGLQLKTRAMVLHEFPFGRGGTVERPGGGPGAVKQEAMSPLMNGNLTNGFR